MSNKNYDKIQDYLDGELSTADQQAFENALSSDVELKQELELHRLANDSIELLIEQNLRHSFKEWSTTDSVATTNLGDNRGGARVVSIRRITRQLAVAASILIIIGFFGGLYMGNQYSDSAMAKTYFDSGSGLRSTANDGGVFAEGIALLEQEQLAAAETFFSGQFEERLQTEANYYLGLAQFGQDRFAEAKATFSKVIADEDVRFSEKAEFNYLLSSMGAGQADEDEQFEILLESILDNPDHFAYTQVQQLSKKRNAFWRYFSF
ncbi:MAG: hypothetical protein HRU40_16500 [Saprospiraceae bacterium]|nr:hypothetical protein [Saprospiraceae bacterium]